MSLDRIVFFMSKFYKGITPSNTFGRINENGKPKSMMAEVVRLKDTDIIMSFIYQNYLDWIQDAVKPRDTITHYENLTLSFKLSEDKMNDKNFIPVFSNKKREIENLDSKKIKKNVYKWYFFINKLLELILEEKIRNK